MSLSALSALVFSETGDCFSSERAKQKESRFSSAARGVKSAWLDFRGKSVILWEAVNNS